MIQQEWLDDQMTVEPIITDVNLPDLHNYDLQFDLPRMSLKPDDLKRLNSFQLALARHHGNYDEATHGVKVRSEWRKRRRTKTDEPGFSAIHPGSADAFLTLPYELITSIDAQLLTTPQLLLMQFNAEDIDEEVKEALLMRVGNEFMRR
jgi:hypothetical protein